MSLELPHMKLAQMSRWYIVSRAIHVVAKLNVADQLSNTPTPINIIAEKTKSHPESLFRIMRFLSAYDVFKYEHDGFALTPLSASMQTSAENSIRDVLLMVDDTWWSAFAKLDISVKTGESAFFHEHGDEFFSFLSKHPEKQNNFDKGMAKLSTYDEKAIVDAYPFDKCESIIDCGAGRGGLVKAIHKKAPMVPITLFDTDSVISKLTFSDYPKSISIESGSFFEIIPPHKTYIYKGVLHDFNDEALLQILTNTKKQMPKGSKLLVIEQVMPEDNLPHPNKTMDIVMMGLLSGRQRTLKEWETIISPIGFKLNKTYPTKSIFTILEYVPN